MKAPSGVGLGGIGVGVIASFPAREVIVGTLGTIYSLGSSVEEDDHNLVTAIQSATWPDGRKVYNVPVALSIMVFFAAMRLNAPSTLMVIRAPKTNSWRWPVFTFVYMTALAYVGRFWRRIKLVAADRLIVSPCPESIGN